MAHDRSFVPSDPIELEFSPPYWLHGLLWNPPTLYLALALRQLVKGAIVGLQWGTRMHGFDQSERRLKSAEPAPR